MATTYSPSSGSRSVLERLFALQERGSSVEREVIAGLATFMTMAYIIFVNPQVLKSAGMPVEAVAAATCIAAAIPTLLMGLWANYPFALASGMGLNAALAMQATRPGMDWQTMMGVIVVEGALVTILVLTRVREQVMQAIPMNLKRAIGVGIGIFIAFLGLQHAGWVQRGEAGAFLTHGLFTTKGNLVSAAGLVLLMLLLAFRVRGAILLGILGTAVIAFVADRLTPNMPALTTLPERWVAIPDFSTFGQANIVGALQPALIGVIFAFLITDFFDTMGTVIGIGGQGGFLDEQGNLPRLDRVLLTDSLAAVWGGLCGASSVTTYIESAAGISEGGRTGLTSIVVGILFLLSLLFAPLVAVVPGVATAPALVIVGYLMIRVVHEMEFDSVEEGIPAFLTMLLIPFTQSISFGIGVGFISYVVVMLLRGKGHAVSPWMYGIALLFALSFAWGV
ncbi:MAG: hypothetical protein C4335_10910 [Armatimonadota bacterium]